MQHTAQDDWLPSTAKKFTHFLLGFTQVLKMAIPFLNLSLVFYLLAFFFCLQELWKSNQGEA